MIKAQLISINRGLYFLMSNGYVRTINIGNPSMTRELLKGNPCMLMYVGYNGDSRVQYASCQQE